MTKNLTLNIEDLEDRIAPDLMLPNGNIMFAAHDNPSPQFSCHPSLANGAMLHSNWNGIGPWSSTGDFVWDGETPLPGGIEHFPNNGAVTLADSTGMDCSETPHS